MDELLAKMFGALPMANPNVGSRLYWILQKAGFTLDVVDTMSSTGLDLTFSDPGWIKVNGMAKMAVTKGVFTQEEVDNYVTKYTTAAESKNFLCTSIAFLYSVSSPK